MITRKFVDISSGRRLNELQRLGSQLKCISTAHQLKNPFTQSDLKVDLKVLSNSNTSRSLNSSHTCANEHYGHYKIENALSILAKYELYCDSKVNQTISQQNPGTETLDAILGEQRSDLDNSDFLRNFELLSYLAQGNNEDIGDPKYHELLKSISSRISTFSDEEILLLLDFLELWSRDVKNLNYRDFYKSVDQECLQRYRDWNVQKLLSIHYKFFKLDLSRRSKFITKSLKKLGNKLETMSKSELVQLAFMIYVAQWATVNMYIFEHTVEQMADELTADELGVIALAFVKQATPVRSQGFLIKIMQKLINNIHSVSDFSLGSVLQILRYIHEPNSIKGLNNLLEALVPQVPHRNLIVLAECMSLQRRTICENKNLTTSIVQRLEKDIESASIKIILRLLSALSTFNYDPKTTSIYSIAMNSLLSPTREEEINKYGHLFNEILVWASHVDFYSKEALSHAFNKEVVDTLCANKIWSCKRNYVDLNEYVEIEHPEYDGPRLEEAVLKKLHKRHGSLSYGTVNLVLKSYKYKKLLDEVRHSCEQIFGPDLPVHTDFPLAGAALKIVILCQDGETKEFICPAEKFSSMPRGSIKYAPNDGNKYFALIMGTYNLFSRNTGEYVGRLAQQIRQIRIIGYTPIVINGIEWTGLNEEEKRTHLKRLLNI